MKTQAIDKFKKATIAFCKADGKGKNSQDTEDKLNYNSKAVYELNKMKNLLIIHRGLEQEVEKEMRGWKMTDLDNFSSKLEEERAETIRRHEESMAWLDEFERNHNNTNQSVY